MLSNLGRLLLGLSSVFASLATAQNFSSKPPTIPPESALQKASQTATGNPSKCPAPSRYFPQVIDHATFDGNYSDASQIFLQQYQVNDTFYKPGGPIFFYQGTESAAPCAEFMAMFEWAAEVNAVMVVLEHRYFGISCPYGLNCSAPATWENAAYNSLTLDNVFGDGRSFLAWFKTVAYPEAKDAKVILGSGSYGGFLSLLWRIHYPDDIYAAIPASGPTKGLVSDPNDPLVFSIGEWTNMVYSDASVQAAKTIQQGMSSIREQLTNGNFSGLQEKLHLCTPLNSTTMANEVLFQILSSYATAAQQNHGYNKYPFQQIINATIASAHDPIAAVGAAIAINNVANAANRSCIPSALNYVSRDPFTWIRCTYVPYADGLTREGSIFGPILPNPSYDRYFDPWCQASFQMNSVEGGTAFIKSLGLDQATIESTSRLLVVEDLIDPTTALGPDSWNPGQTRNHSRILFVSQSSHGDVYMPQSPTDSEALVQARGYIVNSIKEWLA